MGGESLNLGVGMSRRSLSWLNEEGRNWLVCVPDTGSASWSHIARRRVFVHSFILLVGVGVYSFSLLRRIPSFHNFWSPCRKYFFLRDREYLIAPTTLATPLTGDEHSLMQPVIRSNSRQEMHEYVIPKLAPMNNFLLSCTLSL